MKEQNVDIFSGALRRDYVSKLIKPSDQGRGWLDFMKASEVINQAISDTGCFSKWASPENASRLPPPPKKKKKKCLH